MKKQVSLLKKELEFKVATIFLNNSNRMMS